MSRKSAILCFVLLVYFVKQDAFADKEDKSEEVEDVEYRLSEGNFSAEASGPPDSHEAMNNREISSQLSKSNREKRSYEFLMGLVNNNSRFEVTNVDLPPPEERKRKGQMVANEALLELMVKIASDPDQWEKVHKLLQKLDSDLVTSKKIMDRLQSAPEVPRSKEKDSHIYFEKKEDLEGHTNTPVEVHETVEVPSDPTTQTWMKNTTENVRKMINILNGQTNQKPRNHTEEAIKANKWPEFEPEGRILYKPESENSKAKYPWQNDKAGSKSYPRNFAYHRVTGHPLFHSNFDKNPKAYIAVSVIAPKPLNSRPHDEDLILENELRQLKPWTHKQNLKNMAAIRSRWVIQSDNNNKEPAAP